MKKETPPPLKIQVTKLENILPSVFYMSYLFENDIKNYKENYSKCYQGERISQESLSCYSFFSVFVKRVIEKYKLIQDMNNDGGGDCLVEEKPTPSEDSSSSKGINKRLIEKSTLKEDISSLYARKENNVNIWKRKNTSDNSLNYLRGGNKLIRRIQSVESLKTAVTGNNWKKINEKIVEKIDNSRNNNNIVSNSSNSNNNSNSTDAVNRRININTHTSIEFNKILGGGDLSHHSRIEYIREGGFKKFRERLFQYYNLKNSQDNKTLVLYSSKYGSHIEKVIANKIRCSGIQVLEALRIYRGYFTSRPDGLCYLPCFLLSQPSITIVPLEIKSTYSVNNLRCNIFHKGVPFSHLFQMLSHCALHNSPICIYIYYHRSSGCHKLSFIYDEKHLYFLSIIKIMNVLSEHATAGDDGDDKSLSQCFDKLLCDTTIPFALHSLINLICENIHKFRSLLKEYIPPKSPFQTKHSIKEHQQSIEMIFARNIETISEIYDQETSSSSSSSSSSNANALSFDSIHRNVYFYNNISCLCVENTSSDWSSFLSPPYNDFAYWKRLSQFLA